MDERLAEPAWTTEHLAQPHTHPEKARRVQDMFTAIAPKYDLNNRIHSFGRDRAWRKAAVRFAGLRGGEAVADIACGTGDLTLAFADALRKFNQRGPTPLGIDFTFAMLPLAGAKATANSPSTPGERAAATMPARFAQGDAMALPLPDASVDVVSIAFGIRNVLDIHRALAEFFRVLRPGGRLIILEFTVPQNRIMRLGYDFYCGWLMPRTAGWIARDKTGAYRYLPRSVSTFISTDGLQEAIGDAGFDRLDRRSLTGGIAAIYKGVKP